MILAGVDEAGYGSLLGPLIVGCAAMAVPDALAAGEAEFPDLWAVLRRIVSKSRPRNSTKLHIADSKQVYTPAIGLASLERSLLAIATSAGRPTGSLDEIVRGVCPTHADELLAVDWYRGESGEAFPFAVDPMSAKIAGNALRAEMTNAGLQFTHLAADVFSEQRFNRLVEQMRNKASVSFSAVAVHFYNLLNQFGDQNLTIVCDRQGGREHYGPLLRTMFPDWSLEIHLETPARAEYKLIDGSRGARIIFAEKSESFFMPVAIASMLSKYLRESLMHRFNQFWRGHVPGIKPTAGYYTDGLRFLEDIRDARTR